MSTSNLIDKITFTEILDGTIKAIYKDVVEIFNNEVFTLQFNKLIFTTSEDDINDVQLLKINIDWGDGQSETISKKLYSTTSSIGGYEPESWKIITHRYNTDKKNVYLTNDIRALPKITITLYNTFNDVVKIYIPYKLVYKSIYDLGTQFKMLDANITNDNHTSFVMRNKTDDSLLVLGVKNWKKIYGDDQIVYIDDDNVSVDYSDQFVNEDSMVWDWDAVPQINLEVKVRNDGNISWFECTFTEKNINLDSWTPRCFKMTDVEQGQELTEIDIDENTRTFRIYNKGEVNVGGNSMIGRKPLEIGMYKIYVEMTGVNGVSGISNVRYIKGDENQAGQSVLHSDKLEVPMSGFSKIGDNEISYNVTLPDYAYVSHISSAKIILSCDSIDGSNNGIQSNEINYEKPQYPISFSYEIPLHPQNATTANGQTYYTLTIPYNDIPNGNYSVSVDVRQKTKTLDDFSQKSIYQNGKVFDIDTLQVRYCNIGDIAFDGDIIDDNTRFCEYNWTITNPSEMRNVMFRISKLNLDNSIQEYIVDKVLNYQNFNYTLTNGSYSFNEKVQPETIKDGKYNVEIAHIIPMGLFIGQRQKVASRIWNYVYPAPDMKIKSIVPYLKRNYDSLVPYFRIISYNPTEEEIDGLEINYGNNTKLCGVELINDIPATSFDENGQLDVSIKAYNVKDNIYKRKHVNPTVYKIKKEHEIPTDWTTVKYKNQNVSTGVQYIDEYDKSQTTGLLLQRNTIYNIPKKYKFIDTNDNVYFGYNNDVLHYTFNDMSLSPQFVLFNLHTYHEKFNSTKRVKRFVPNTQEITLKSVYELPDVQTYLKSKGIYVQNSYNSTLDRSEMFISSKNPIYQNDISEVQDAIVTLYKNNEIVYSANLRNKFNASIKSLIPGEYDLTVQFHSVNTNNITTPLYVCSSKSAFGVDQVIPSLNLKVKDSQIMKQDFYISRGIDGTSIYGNVIYSLYHKNLTKFNLNYKVFDIIEQVDGNGYPTGKTREELNFSDTIALNYAAESNTLDVVYTFDKILKSGQVLEYWFQFDGKTIEWSHGNENHIFPFEKRRINIL